MGNHRAPDDDDTQPLPLPVPADDPASAPADPAPAPARRNSVFLDPHARHGLPWIVIGENGDIARCATEQEALAMGPVTGDDDEQPAPAEPLPAWRTWSRWQWAGVTAAGVLVLAVVLAVAYLAAAVALVLGPVWLYVQAKQNRDKQRARELAAAADREQAAAPRRRAPARKPAA